MYTVLIRFFGFLLSLTALVLGILFTMLGIGLTSAVSTLESISIGLIVWGLAGPLFILGVNLLFSHWKRTQRTDAVSIGLVFGFSFVAGALLFYLAVSQLEFGMILVFVLLVAAVSILGIKATQASDSNS